MVGSLRSTIPRTSDLRKQIHYSLPYHGKSTKPFSHCVSNRSRALPAQPSETTDPAFLPAPTAWTLRFKVHRTTVLLHVEPQTPFPQIKAALLAALRGTATPPELPENVDLPTDPASVEFGAPVDRLDLTQGWVPLEIPGDASGKVKKGVLNDSPMGAGLKDGAALAVRFKEEEDEDAMDEDKEWDVVLPGYEDDEEME